MNAPEPEPGEAPAEQLIEMAQRLSRADAALQAAERALTLARRAADLSLRLSREIGPAEIAVTVVDEVVATLGAVSGGLWTLDQGSDVLKMARIVDEVAADRYVEVPLASDTPLAQSVRTNEAIWLTSPAEYEARFPASFARVKQLRPGELAIAVLPTEASGRVFGGLVISVSTPRPFTADEREFLVTVARHCGQALERFELRTHAADAVDRATRLQKAIAALAVCDTVEEVARVVVEQCAAAMHADRSAMAVPGEPGELVMVATRGVPQAVVEDYARFPVDAKVGIALAFRTGTAHWLESPADFDRVPGTVLNLRRTGSQAAASVPLLVGGRPIASMSVGFDRPRRTTAAEKELIIALTSQAAQALARVQLAERERAARREADAQREQLHRFFLQTPMPVALFEGPEHRFVLVNPMYVELMGGRELLGRSLREALPELVPTGVVELLDRVYREGTRMDVTEFAAQPPGVPDRHFFNFAIEPVKDLTGVVRGLITAGFDVTEQVRGRVATEAANRGKDEFLALLGHELRNPLSPIVTALQLMRMRDESALRRERDVIERQVQHLVRLVDDLLDVSRVTRGKVQLDRAPVEIAGVVARAVEMASPLLEQRRHTLAVDVPLRGLLVSADEARLAQVLTNLLMNSAKFTPEGGNVRVSARREGAEIVVRVRDDGAGIEPALLPRVFDLFVQGPAPADRGRTGLGLGLTLVRSLTELHGGHVEAHSEGAGKGSEFVVRLPALQGVAAPPPEPARRRVRRARTPQRVLLVDDNVDAALLLRDVLEAAGHTVEVAHDGPSALAVLDRFTPTTAILDLGLPVMNGYELAARVQARLGAGVRLIALTGYGQDADRQRTAAAGFEAHFVRPVDLDVLLSRIDG